MEHVIYCLDGYAKQILSLPKFSTNSATNDIVDLCNKLYERLKNLSNPETVALYVIHYHYTFLKKNGLTETDEIFCKMHDKIYIKRYFDLCKYN
jgi:hypothetical protein